MALKIIRNEKLKNQFSLVPTKNRDLSKHLYIAEDTRFNKSKPFFNFQNTK